MAENAGSIIYDVEFHLQQMAAGQREIDKRLTSVENNFNDLGAAVSRVAGAITAALSVREIANYANAWVDVNNKLVNSVKAGETLVDVTERVFAVSQETRSSLDATATLYGRLERATREAGVSTEDLAKLTTTINKGLIVSGASAEEASSAITQLSQGLAAGVLRGEEFNTLTESGSRLAVGLADSLGVTVGQLRAMAAEGKLTTDVVVKGLLSQGDVIAKEFGKTAITMGQAFEVAGNNITKFVGESTTVKSVLSIFNDSVVALSENLGAISNLVLIAAAAVGSRYAGALAVATTKALQTAAAQGVLASSLGLANKALALIGGPAGLAFLAASAIFYFFQKSQQAKQEALAFADTLDNLTSKMKSMSSAQLSAEIAKTSQALRGQTDAIKDQQEVVESLTKKVESYRVSQKIYGESSRSAANLRDTLEELAIETAKLEEMEGKSSKTKSTLNLLQNTLNGTLKTGIDLLKRDGQEADIASGMIAKLGDMINFASKAKEKFNSSSLQVQRSVDADKMLADLQQENALLAIKDDRQRAIARASAEAQSKGAQANSNQLRQIEEEAAKQYDLQQVKKESVAATKSASKAMTDSQKESQAIIDTLARQKEAVDRINTGYAEGSIELAKYDAVKALGNSATQEQIKQAEEYAAAQFKASEAVKNLSEVEQGRKYAQQEVAAGATIADPSTGVVADPLAQINLQEQQKLDALAKYQAIDVANLQLYEDAKTAIQLQASAERKRILDEESTKNNEALSNLLGGASSAFSAIAGAISNSAGESSAAYRALFAVSKGFAIAQAALNAQVAISNAMAIPWPANIPAIAQAVAAGSQIVSAVQSANYGGARKNGGSVSAGSMYRVGEGGAPEIYQASSGKQYMIPGDNGKVISNKDMQGGAPVVNLNIQNYSSARIEQQTTRGNDGSVTIAMIVADINNGGEVGQAIAYNHDAPRRARG